MKIVITGADGMLGQDLQHACKAHEIVALNRNTLDITDREKVMQFIAAEQPDLIVNAAAYNAVDLAEGDGKEMAFAVNGRAPGYLAEAANAVHAMFVHVSTDYVFSGDKREYSEHDSPDPISAYGESKAFGEMRVKEVYAESTEPPHMYIVRTSKLFGKPGVSAAAKRSFAAIMLEKARLGEPLKIVHDETGCPTYTKDLAEAIRTLAEEVLATNHAVAQEEVQVLHFVNEGPGVTWYEFAQEIFEIANLNPEAEPVPASTFPRPAKRPGAVILQNNFHIQLPDRKNALQRFIEDEG